MLLEHKNAVIYGAGGAIGGAVARAFAREGAKVFLAGRTLAKLDAVANDISAAGGVAETAQVDALDEQAVREHVDAVAAKAGGIDVALNAVGIPHVQGTPFAEHARTDTLLRRLPTLAEVANVAAFMASDQASAMTGTVANLTCGSLVD